MTIEPTELTVEPGSAVTTTVTVRNLGTRVEEFRLLPHGPAATFAALTPTTLSIYPDDEQHATVRFAPPRDPQSPAGVTPFEIMASSVIHTDVNDVALGRLTVTPFHELRAVLTPEVSRGRSPARHQVSVTNGGNTPVNAQLAFRDQDGELTFTPPGGTAMLRPGTTQDFPFRINGPRRWFGRTTRLPFAAVVTPTGTQPPITLPGTRQQTAVFPWWIPTAAVAVVAIAIALFALLKPGTPTVPQVADRTQSVAEHELRNAGYVVDGATPISDPKAAGVVVRTDPGAGSPLEKGKRVQLLVSTGPCNPVCRRTVPATKGRTEAEARTLLGDAGFTVGQVVPGASDLPAGTVTETSPAELTEAPTNVAVVVIVSSGPLPSSPSPLAAPGPLPSSGSPSEPGSPSLDLPSPRPQDPVRVVPVPLPSSNPPPPTPAPPDRTCSPTSSADQPLAGLTITSPSPEDWLGEVNESHGTARLASGQHLWLLLCAPGIQYFYFVSDDHRETPVFDDAWHEQIYLNPNEHGNFFLYAVIVDAEDSQRLDKSSADGGESPFVTELPHSARFFRVKVHCCS